MAATIDSLKTTTENLIKGLSLKSTMVHAEYIITPKGVYLLEVAGRGCGAAVSLLIPKISNFSQLKEEYLML